MKRPAVFMDRDGTINEQMGYINHPSRFVLLPGAAQAIRLLNLHGFLAIVVSNQSGVARGYFPLELVHEVHDILRARLREQGAHLDGIYFCPHYEGGKVPGFSVPCECRKPRTGLIRMAREAYDIDMERSYVVGDRFSDMELASRAGLRGILVETGYGRGDLAYVLPGRDVQPDHVAVDLHAAVEWIVECERDA